MTTEEFRKICAVLYGPQWQRPLSREVRVSDRTVRRWAAGRPVPDWIPERLMKLVSEKIDELQRALNR